jgi:hypothetical protein
MNLAGPEARRNFTAASDSTACHGQTALQLPDPTGLLIAMSFSRHPLVFLAKVKHSCNESSHAVAARVLELSSPLPNAG